MSGHTEDSSGESRVEMTPLPGRATLACDSAAVPLPLRVPASARQVVQAPRGTWSRPGGGKPCPAAALETLPPGGAGVRARGRGRLG